MRIGRQLRRRPAPSAASSPSVRLRPRTRPSVRRMRRPRTRLLPPRTQPPPLPLRMRTPRMLRTPRMRPDAAKPAQPSPESADGLLRRPARCSQSCFWQRACSRGTGGFATTTPPSSKARGRSRIPRASWSSTASPSSSPRTLPTPTGWIPREDHHVLVRGHAGARAVSLLARRTQLVITDGAGYDGWTTLLDDVAWMAGQLASMVQGNPERKAVATEGLTVLNRLSHDADASRSGARRSLLKGKPRTPTGPPQGTGKRPAQTMRRRTARQRTTQTARQRTA